MMPFSCVIMGKFLFLRKLFANGDRHSRTDIRHPRIDIQVELPHFSNRDLYLLTVYALIRQCVQKHERQLLLAIPMRAL